MKKTLLALLTLLPLIVACGPSIENTGELGDPCDPQAQDCSDGLLCALSSISEETLLASWTCEVPMAQEAVGVPCLDSLDCQSGLCWVGGEGEDCDGGMCCAEPCTVGVDTCESSGIMDHPYCKPITPQEPIGSCSPG